MAKCLDTTINRCRKGIGEGEGGGGRMAPTERDGKEKNQSLFTKNQMS